MILLDDVHLRLESAAGPGQCAARRRPVGRPGETVSVVGPSGSGKTTMLMVIAGLERPTAGRVVVAGQRFRRARRGRAGAASAATHVGIVFQDFHLIPTMTALENVAMPLEFAGRADAFDARRRGGLDGGRAGPPAEPLSRPALGRRAAARGAGPRLVGRAAPAAGRRADRQPGRRHRRTRSSSCCSACAPAGHDAAADHPRPGAGRALRPRGAAGGRPHRPRRRPAPQLAAGVASRVQHLVRWRLRLARRELRGGLARLPHLPRLPGARRRRHRRRRHRCRAATEAGLQADGRTPARRRHRGAADPARRDCRRAALAAHARGAPLADVVEMRAMAARPAGETRRLVELKAVDGAYPLYGDVCGSTAGSRLADAARRPRRRPGAPLVEPALLDRLGLRRRRRRPGRRGQPSGSAARSRQRAGPRRQRLQLRAARAWSLAPRCQATGLIQPGSLIRLRHYALRPADRRRAAAASPTALGTRRFRDAGWRIRDARQGGAGRAPLPRPARRCS